MNRQVVAVGYGGPEQLEVREHDPGAPGDGQVLVEVRAIGVNAWDVKNEAGEDVTTGVYIFAVESNGNRKTGKVAVIR